MAAYSRENPSPHYKELMGIYQQLHANGMEDHNLSAEKTFPGTSVFPVAEIIRQMIENTGSKTLLDYGCGKGQQYEMRNMPMADGSICPSLQHFWKLDEIRPYDPGFAKHNQYPTGKYDGVISTDVLEHCPEEDMEWILEELFSHANKFVFANIACYPAMKTLPNGENAHITIRPPEWWHQLITLVASRYPDVHFQFMAQYMEQRGDKPIMNTVVFLPPHSNKAA